MSEPGADVCTTRDPTTAMSAPERVSSEEFRDIAQALRDFIRLALLRAQDRQRENTASASSVDVPDSGSTKYTSFRDNIGSVRAVIVYIV